MLQKTRRREYKLPKKSGEKLGEGLSVDTTNFVIEHKTSPKRIVFLLGIFFYAILFALACIRLPGSLFEYAIFTLSAALMLWLGLRNRLGYGASILTVFLWLGLWLKLTVNIILSRPYTEATGGFDFSSQQYDELMVVATLVCLGISAAWMISIRWLAKIRSVDIDPVESNLVDDGRAKIPQKYLWISLALAIALLNIANIQFGFVQSGLVARKVFPWPTNAIVCWFFYSGLSFLVAALLYWDFLRNRNFSTGILVALFEATLGGMTTISRGLYLWHMLPIVWAAWVNKLKFRKSLSTRSLIFFSVVAMVGFIVVGTLVNVFRLALYDPRLNTINAEMIYSTRAGEFAENGGQLFNLVVDRWVGVEGIMVSVGYKSKSVELFEELLAEKPAIGHITKYQYISNSNYRQVDASKYQFNTIPGVGGFLYLSGSLWIVFVGTLLLALCVTGSERLIQFVSDNPFFCAVSGVYMANMVAQIGVTPRQLIAQIAMNFAIIIFISLVQAYWLRKGWIANNIIYRNKAHRG